jgi:hypothetical protein
MEFTVEFYETVNGGSPVQAFLDKLKQSVRMISRR